jgi:flagellar basal-body rod protein FlgC
MNLFGLMETSGSAMQAERMRAEVVAANMANAETTRTESGGPYRRHHVVFTENAGPDFSASLAAATGGSGPLATPGLWGSSEMRQPAGGIHVSGVIEDASAPLKRYDPGHPDAGPDGYVSYPDINPITEMVDLMGATRAYGLNGSAIQAEKGMIVASVEIVKS